MSVTAIRVEGIGKQYRLGTRRRRYRTLREEISRWAREMAGGGDDGDDRASGREDRIWALRDVSFEIASGEVVGIIGPNGAGKSTLLKILSQVTVPTTGIAEVHGHVGSLLEVGTGFHPELTGRENVYLNGAILGMGRGEIERKFDAIVEFAEIERFLDTPIKHYSSGMYLRLAFAVAAHLDPEILLVDEVLAVGDASFQRKCLGKMDSVARAGRTVLFVSHNMDAVRRLCSRCILLERGTIAAHGATAGVVARYLENSYDRPAPGTWLDLSHLARHGTGEARFVAMRYSSHNQEISGHAYPNGRLELELEILSNASRSVDSMAASLYTHTGTKLINADIASEGERVHLNEGRNFVRLRIEELHLNPGAYTVGLWLGFVAGEALDHLESAFEIEVIQVESRGLGITPLSNGAVTCRFEVTRTDPFQLNV